MEHQGWPHCFKPTKANFFTNNPLSSFFFFSPFNQNTAIMCKASDTLGSVITRLAVARIHRIYLCDHDRRPYVVKNPDMAAGIAKQT